jgi:phosphoenolpyruvate carboxykinase (ATP)
VVSNEGALCAYSGRKTGREPQNLRLVRDGETDKFINWGKTNIPMDYKSYRLVERLVTDYISHKHRVFVVDGYAGWDSANRIKVRTFTSRSYHALFMRNMLIRPSLEDLENDFSKGVDMHIFNAGDLQASKNIEGITGDMVTALNLKEKKLVIMGSQFAGEMKKGIFKMLQYYYPKKGILTLHASVTEGSKGDTALLCGLSGTGKTALVMNSYRKLLGDD